MRKNYYVFGIIMLLLTITGCTLNKEEPAKLATVQHWKPLVSETTEWSSMLLETGSLSADLNMDGKTDQITFLCSDKEGSSYIDNFQLEIDGNKGEFSIHDYNALFKQIELFDFNQDNVNEIILRFDTKGGGGEGTHDIYVLWIETNDVKAILLDPYVKGVEDNITPHNIDGIYSLERVEYQGETKLLTRQYMWGEDGHSDKVGDLISIVTLLDSTSEAFNAEVSWVEEP